MSPAPKMPQLDGVEHHYVEANGVRLHYAQAGSPSAPAVLLQHGWPQHWWMWRYLIPPLAERYRVIVPDLRGHGWSDKPQASYRKDEMMRDIIALLDQLEIERVRYVGHDWGAYVGMLASLRHPDRIEQFVSCSIPHPWPTERSLPRLIASGWYQLLLAAPVLGKLAIGRLGVPRLALQRGRAKGSFTDEELDVYTDVIKQPDATEASMRVYRHFLLHELLPTQTGAFKEERLQVPTLWIVGEEDMVAGHADEGYRDHADDMTLEKVPGVAHFLPEEVPELLRDRVMRFFGG
jgi:pimeloyl-ACP methyl ester carboxylesterase